MLRQCGVQECDPQYLERAVEAAHDHVERPDRVDLVAHPRRGLLRGRVHHGSEVRLHTVLGAGRGIECVTAEYGGLAVLSELLRLHVLDSGKDPLALADGRHADSLQIQVPQVLERLEALDVFSLQPQLVGTKSEQLDRLFHIRVHGRLHGGYV